MVRPGASNRISVRSIKSIRGRRVSGQLGLKQFYDRLHTDASGSGETPHPRPSQHHSRRAKRLPLRMSVPRRDALFAPQALKDDPNLLFS